MTDDDRVAAIRRWWDESGTTFVVALVLVVAAVVGWRWYTDAARGSREAASLAYQQYVEQREAEEPDTEAMARALEALDRDHAGSGYHVFSLFFRAADALGREDFAEGEKWLRQALDVADDARLADLARVRLARVLHQVDRDDDALAILQGVKGAGFRSYAAELKGDVLLAAGKKDEALEAYRAAQEVAGEDGKRPLLEMKIADLVTAAPAGTSDPKAAASKDGDEAQATDPKGEDATAP
jgi:predicted negative regulator of RcsB-dependent stress response